jgi:hypothetical protein
MTPVKFTFGFSDFRDVNLTGHFEWHENPKTRKGGTGRDLRFGGGGNAVLSR